MEKEQWFESRIAFMLTTIGVVVTAVLSIYFPINSLHEQVSLENQKLDTLIAWTKQHETDTQTMKQELNLTFADLYQKLGQRNPNPISQ